MKDIELDDVTQAQRNSAEQLLVSMIRAKYPHLDIRSGTALRDLLVTPDATLHAWFSAQADEIRSVSSLQVLLERAAAGETIDTDDINRILSNFNIRGTAGTAARGSVRVVVSAARTYVIPEGFSFEDSTTGLVFRTADQYVVSDQPTDEELKLFSGTANYYFIVPVVCTTVGSAGNIDKGHVLYAQNALPGFVAASSYETFSGGADVEDLESVKARIPVALSTRGLLTATSTEAAIRDRFDSSDHPVIAVSTVGYGNAAQLRDRHNPFGVGVGGRVDVYVRNFTSQNVVTEIIRFSYDPTSGVYKASVSVPGMYTVKSVTDPDDSAVTSYTYSVEYVEPDSVPLGHDIVADSGAVEFAGTVWRKCNILVESTDTSELEKDFKVSVISLPLAEEFQNYFDDPSVRNVGCDYVVRCPAVCNVTMNITCRYPYGTSFDVDAAKTAIANYVNTSGFVGRLTRSEIACVLTGLGAKSVDIDDEYMLTGYVVDATGVSHKLSGDALDIDDVSDPGKLLTRDTCVFSTSISNINISAVPV